MEKKLYKSRTDKKIAGVCGGFAQFFGIDATLIRVVYVVLGLMGWWIFAYPVILYIILALVMPEEPEYPEGQYEQQWQQYQPPYQPSEPQNPQNNDENK